MAPLRILMYSNNSRGLGHTARTLRISAALARTLENCSILVLTDYPAIGRFRFDKGVDYVRLPILDAGTQDRLQSGLNIGIDAKLKMRYEISQSTLKSFRPGVVMLDESLFDHPNEMKRIIAMIADELPEAKVFWQFSDILGTPEWVTQHWNSTGIGEVLANVGDEILVFGAQHLFDLAEKYTLNEGVARKLVYTGYLAGNGLPSQRIPTKFSKLRHVQPLVMVCVGDSTDDLNLIDFYLRFLEEKAAAPTVQSMIFTSPAIPSGTQHTLTQRAAKLPNVGFHRFGKNTLQCAEFADLVICDGEYNLTSELLSNKRVALMAPNAEERPGDFARAQLFQELGLVSIIEAQKYQPLAFSEIIMESLFHGPRHVQRDRYKEIPFDGFLNIAERIRNLTGMTATA